ncbi:Epidermal retinol dehydrogenase [Apis cerana cerana]|uniref:Epidermal retinol dehydrogenase n=1 Tax=Apis cerana cerana TaxID=94128 RepID=A0A2A3E7Y7_APICC|nr:Epidermal retinol dehydrogenase [Apis cerana cerana]
MSSIKNVFTFSHLHLLYDLFVLSMKITFAMTVAAFKMVIPPRAKNLIGETVLITGAGHGIGRELAIQLASLGCIIVCWDIDTEANRSTISMVSKNGGEAYGFVVDVSKRLEVREAARLMRKVGVPEVSILINNAAVLYHRPFLNQESDLVEKTFNVNVLSNFWTIETFLPSMIQNGKGHIVCVCSMCGLMDALHEELRLDPKFNNIRFTTIYPFYVDTGLARDPKYRFPYIFGVISPEYAAKEIIKAFRRNYTEYSIPRCLFTLNSINSFNAAFMAFRIVPETVMRLILDFLADVDRKRQEKLAICETNTS